MAGRPADDPRQLRDVKALQNFRAGRKGHAEPLGPHGGGFRGDPARPPRPHPLAKSLAAKARAAES
jgi:hypothetical protein